MSSTKTTYQHSDDDEYVTELKQTQTQTAEIVGHIPYHQFRASADDGTLVNDGTDTESVVVDVVNGLQFARGNTPADILAQSTGDVTVEIDAADITKSLTDGTLTVDITTQKPAGSIIEVVAKSLASKPAGRDTVEIEVTSA